MAYGNIPGAAVLIRVPREEPMNTLEINDIIDVYYEGRQPFASLPQAPSDHAEGRRADSHSTRHPHRKSEARRNGSAES